MGANSDPLTYDAWYRTRRGSWIGDREFDLLMRMTRPHAGASCLDVGSGTGYFSRRFAKAGLSVTALDRQENMLAYARLQSGGGVYVCGDAQTLPFADQSFDYCMAVTSLCFVADPAQAVREMLRVARYAVVIGLLNRQSLLYHQKQGRGGYEGARWDHPETVRGWLAGRGFGEKIRVRTAVFVPGGGYVGRLVEHCLPIRLPWGGFLAVSFSRQ